MNATYDGFTGMPRRPLRLCFVSADYPQESTAKEGVGGIATHTRTLAHSVAALGHSVMVLTQSPHEAHCFWDGSVRVHALSAEPLRTWKVGRWLPVGWIRRSFAVSRALRRLQREIAFDLVSFPDGAGEGYFYSLSPRTPFVVQLFGPGSLVQVWDSRVRTRTRARIEWHLESYPVRRASVVISATQQFADTIVREWGIDRTRAKIIRNPVNLELFCPGNNPGNMHKTVLFVGHLQRLKGLLTLVAALPKIVRHHPDVEFVLIGNDTNSAPDGTSMKAYLERTLRERALMSYVRFVTPCLQPELVQFYQRCSLFVLPSVRDVYPNALLEAMACGRPCVTTRTVGVAEMIVDGESGFLVPPEDPDILSQTISTVLSMPMDKREEVGLRARRTVASLCDASVIATQTIEAYREVLGQRAAAAAL